VAGAARHFRAGALPLPTRGGSRSRGAPLSPHASRRGGHGAAVRPARGLLAARIKPARAAAPGKPRLL